MAVRAYQMDGMIPVRKQRGFNRAQNRANKFAQAEYGYKGPSRSGQQRDLDTRMLGIDMSSNKQTQAPANWADLDAATFGVVAPNPTGSKKTNWSQIDSTWGNPNNTTTSVGSGRFGTRAADQAYLNYLGRLNANQLKRTRGWEDHVVNRRKLDQAIRGVGRKIPDVHNRRGMRDSGIFDRDMGEYEAASFDSRADLERLYGRSQQDLSLADQTAGQKYYESIGDDAMMDALTKAAQAAAINPSVLTGGSDLSRAATSAALKGAL